MTATHSLTLEELGITTTGRDLQPSVLLSKRKKPGGGFWPNKPEANYKDDIERFWVGMPRENVRGVRDVDPEYGAFNDERLWKHPEWVSSLPVAFGSPLQKHVETFSRGLYRWAKEFGPRPEGYAVPENSPRPWCTTRGVLQEDGPTRRRWVNGSWQLAPCPGGKCEFSTGSDGKPAPCKKQAAIYVWPRWHDLANRVEAASEGEANRRFAAKVRSFP